MTRDDRARTPADVPVAEMERLLSRSLGRGGTFADLYFEHERTSSLLLEEGIIRTASAGVTCGLGVRVVSGERTGYAYTDDLAWEGRVGGWDLDPSARADEPLLMSTGVVRPEG